MQVHVINLKEAVDRRRSITSQLEKLGVRYELFDAVRGSSLSKEELAEKVDMREVAKYPNWLTLNMLGCSLSHLGVYKKIANSSVEWHLILEDDVELQPAVVQFINTFEQNGSAFLDQITLLYAVSVDGNIKCESKELFDYKGSRIYKVRLCPEIGSTGSYIIHRNTAIKMLEKNPLVRVAPDSWHYFFEQGCFKQLNCVYPFLSKPALFESTIGYVNKDSLKYKIKHFVEKYRIPPFYQILKVNRRRIFTQMSKVEFF